MAKPFVRREGSFADKLEKVTVKNPRYSKKPSVNYSLPPTDQIGDDGVGHHHVSNSAATLLGRVLSADSYMPFQHKFFGDFASVKTFWCYITTKERDDRLRGLHGSVLLAESAKYTRINIKNFKAILMDAVWQMIHCNPELIQIITQAETIPFDSYYYYNRSNGVRIRRPEAHWYCRGLEIIREALLRGDTPDFTELRDDDKPFFSDVYNFGDKPEEWFADVTNFTYLFETPNPTKFNFNRLRRRVGLFANKPAQPKTKKAPKKETKTDTETSVDQRENEKTIDDLVKQGSVEGNEEVGYSVPAGMEGLVRH